MAREATVSTEHDTDRPAPPERPRRRGRAQIHRQRHRRVRVIFFGLASLTGFVLGSAAVIGGQALYEPDFRAHVGLALVLPAAAVIAVAAGVFLAVLYRAAVPR